MRTIFSKDVDRWSIEDQLKFYKEQFQSQHCEISGYELRDDWVVYEGELYKTEFYEKTVEKEKKKAIRSILSMEAKIKEFKDKHGLKPEDFQIED